MDLSKLSIFVIPFLIILIVMELLLYLRIVKGIRTEILVSISLTFLFSVLLYLLTPNYGSANGLLTFINLIINFSILVCLFIGLNFLLIKIKSQIVIQLYVFLCTAISVPLFWVMSLYVSCYTGQGCL
jgi:hypothetical protein